MTSDAGFAVITATDELKRRFPNLRIAADEPMSRHTTFRIGGPIKAMLFPGTEDEAVGIWRFLAERGISPLVLGNGSNLLCADGPLDEVAMKMHGLDGIDSLGGRVLRVGAGCLMRRAAEFAARQGLTGLEFAHGIPGSIGGGAVMNAGAYGGQMADVIQSVRILTPDGSVRDLPKEELNYSYRRSRFEESGEIVLSAVIELQEGDPEVIRARMEELMARRREKQPLDKPSAGSTFKRPETGYAAAMIDEAGLKGFGFGGARVSPKHAGFIVNEGGATCEDVLRTMRGVREKVYECFGVVLEPEVRLIGTRL